MNGQGSSPELTAKDDRLVDLVTAALVDPMLDTDLRMRIAGEIGEVLRATHEDLHGPARPEAHEQLLAAHDHQLQKVLRAVLVDPNLHTDLRMRLHEEIPRILEQGRADSIRTRPRPTR